MTRTSRLTAFALFVAALVTVSSASAQMQRTRSAQQPVDELFWSHAIIVLPSTTQLGKGDLDFTIHHTFGPVSSGLNDLFGLDLAANIRFGLDYGVTDQVMVGVGRSRFDKILDFRAKANLLQRDGWQVAGYYNAAAETTEDGRDLADRMSYHGSVLIGKRVTDQLTIQLAPGFSRFVYAPDRDVFGQGIQTSLNNHYSLGTAVRYEARENVSFIAEMITRVGDVSGGTNNVGSFGVDLETGGHVFQMFFTSSQWITPQHAVAWSRTPMADGDFGWGFNVHRVFGTGR
ncbi:MAG: DUF5777 family beta-barrel protein [Rhodothermales bacterium]